MNGGRERDAPPPPGGWETLSRRRVVDDPHLRLDAEHVRTPHGHEMDPWWVLDFPDWVMVVAITEHQEIVLLRQWRQGIREFVLETPGGVIDQGENALAAAARELLEETGYRGQSPREIGTLLPDGNRNNNRCRIILIEHCQRVADPTPEPGETIEVVVMTRAEIMALLRGGEMESAMHVAALYRGLIVARWIELTT